MIALARKYRPKRFADLIAQDHVAAALRGAVAQGRAAHGYLFAGPRGVGKTTAARILAMALNCERKGAVAGEPCGECDACLRTWNGSAGLDVVELDAASNRGVDDARDLRERAMYAASTEGHHKVYIVDEAHMLTREAWNALLKILEEPPPKVVFVFATTEPHKIAQTAAPVLSRLQRFDFRRIGPHAIAERLQAVVRAEGIAAADDALHLIAKSADGGMRDALSVLDQVLSFGEGPITAARVRAVLGLIPDELYGEMLRLVAERDAAGVFPLVERLLEAGADLGEFVDGAGETLRALLIAGLGGQPEGLTEGLAQVVRGAAGRLPPPDVVRLLAVLGEMEVQIRRGGNTRLAVELLLLRWAMMDRTVELAEVLTALGKGDRGQGKGPAAAPPAPPQLRDVAPSAAAPVPIPPSPVPTERGPASLDRLRALWPRIVADVRAENPMIASLVAEAVVSAVAGGVVTLSLTDAHHAEGVDRKRDALAQVMGRYVTEPLRVRVAVGGERAAGSGGTAAARGERLTEQSANAERLKSLRQKDPTLNAAADALDLELLE
jgi:DNA polymerase-3 subunit gamma/tau